jgi:hypothetical protein
MEAGTVRETIKTLGNILYLKDGRSKCNIIIPGLNLNGLYGILPGTRPKEPGRDAMLANIGLEGISAMMVAGDLPPIKTLKKLKFLVQMNMFKTEMTEYADVFLPATGLLENEGHFPTLDGKIKRVRRTVASQGMARPILSIIASIAKEMEGSRFSPRAAVVWKEIRGRIEKRTRKDRKLLLAFKPVDPSIPVPAGKLSPKKTAAQVSWPDHTLNGYGSYLYRGNRLYELVPDLKSLMEQMVIEKK